MTRRQTLTLWDRGFLKYVNAVHLACHRNQPVVLKRLLNRGARIDAVDSLGMTPLHYACRLGHDEIVAILLDRGANVKMEDCDGSRPLFTAIECHIYNDTRTMKIVKLLTYAGADINHTDKYGRTALSAALERKYNDIVVFLIQNGANIKIYGKSKNKTEDLITLINECHKMTETLFVISNCLYANF
jgi:ankyrin repeat protein